MERKREGGTVDRWGWHVDGETAGCLPTGSDAAAGAGRAHMSFCTLDIAFFVRLRVEN